MDDSPWKVGAEVVQASSGFGGRVWGRISQVEKVYKNGNVVINGRQYRPNKYPAPSSREWHASPTNAGKSSNSYVVLVTEEVRAAMTRSAAVLAAHRVSRDLQAALSQLRDDDDLLKHEQAIRALLSAINPPKEAAQ